MSEEWVDELAAMLADLDDGFAGRAAILRSHDLDEARLAERVAQLAPRLASHAAEAARFQQIYAARREQLRAERAAKSRAASSGAAVPAPAAGIDRTSDAVPVLDLALPFVAGADGSAALARQGAPEPLGGETQEIAALDVPDWPFDSSRNR